jgi:hypothetical protein
MYLMFGLLSTPQMAVATSRVSLAMQPSMGVRRSLSTDERSDLLGLGLRLVAELLT